MSIEIRWDKPGHESPSLLWVIEDRALVHLKNCFDDFYTTTNKRIDEKSCAHLHPRHLPQLLESIHRSQEKDPNESLKDLETHIELSITNRYGLHFWGEKHRFNQGSRNYEQQRRTDSISRRVQQLFSSKRYQ